jgi:hypothetical protein
MIPARELRLWRVGEHQEADGANPLGGLRHGRESPCGEDEEGGGWAGVAHPRSLTAPAWKVVWRIHGMLE